MSRSQLLEHVLPLLRRMCTGDYSTTRIAAAPLFAFVYSQMPSPAQAEMRGYDFFCEDLFPTQCRCSLFSQLCRDNAPIVRKAACGGIGVCKMLFSQNSYLFFTDLQQLASKMDVDLVQAELIPLFIKLAQDDQDSVRILAVDNCVALGKVLSPAVVNSQVLPIVRSLAQDKSWRVRYMVADKFTDVISSLSLSPKRELQ